MGPGHCLPNRFIRTLEVKRRRPLTYEGLLLAADIVWAPRTVACGDFFDPCALTSRCRYGNSGAGLSVGQGVVVFQRNAQVFANRR